MYPLKKITNDVREIMVPHIEALRILPLDETQQTSHIPMTGNKKPITNVKIRKKTDGFEGRECKISEEFVDSDRVDPFVLFANPRKELFCNAFEKFSVTDDSGNKSSSRGNII